MKIKYEIISHDTPRSSDCFYPTEGLWDEELVKILIKKGNRKLKAYDLDPRQMREIDGALREGKVVEIKL